MKHSLLIIAAALFGIISTIAFSSQQDIGDFRPRIPNVLDELERNLEANELPFYALGSYMYGYRLPGLSDEELDHWVKQEDYPFQVRFSDDPSPLGADADFWERAESFVARYNRFVVLHLNACRSKEGERKRTEKGVSSSLSH